MGEKPYYIHHPLENVEVLARLLRRVGTDSLMLEWVRVAPSLEGSTAHVRAETTVGKTLEAELHPVASGLQSVIAEGQQVRPSQVSCVILEFAEAA